MTNRGYFARRYAMQNKLLETIVYCNKENKKFAILNIGSGNDTFTFKLAEFCAINNINTKNIYYLELDLPSVIRKKLTIIKNDKSKILQDKWN